MVGCLVHVGMTHFAAILDCNHAWRDEEKDADAFNMQQRLLITVSFIFRLPTVSKDAHDMEARLRASVEAHHLGQHHQADDVEFGEHTRLLAGHDVVEDSAAVPASTLAAEGSEVEMTSSSMRGERTSEVVTESNLVFVEDDVIKI